MQGQQPGQAQGPGKAQGADRGDIRAHVGSELPHDTGPPGPHPTEDAT